MRSFRLLRAGIFFLSLTFQRTVSEFVSDALFLVVPTVRLTCVQPVTMAFPRRSRPCSPRPEIGRSRSYAAEDSCTWDVSPLGMPPRSCTAPLRVRSIDHGSGWVLTVWGFVWWTGREGTGRPSPFRPGFPPPPISDRYLEDGNATTAKARQLGSRVPPPLSHPQRDPAHAMEVEVQATWQRCPLSNDPDPVRGPKEETPGASLLTSPLQEPSTGS